MPLKSINQPTSASLHNQQSSSTLHPFIRSNNVFQGDWTSTYLAPHSIFSCYWRSIHNPQVTSVDLNSGRSLTSTPNFQLTVSPLQLETYSIHLISLIDFYLQSEPLLFYGLPYSFFLRLTSSFPPSPWASVSKQHPLSTKRHEDFALVLIIVFVSVCSVILISVITALSMSVINIYRNKW